MAAGGVRHALTRRGLFKAGAATGVAAAAIGVMAGCGRNTKDDDTAPTVVNDKSADYVIDPQVQVRGFQEGARCDVDDSRGQRAASRRRDVDSRHLCRQLGNAYGEGLRA